MPVILAEGSEMLQPLVDIGNQSVFGVVHPHACSNMHGGYQNHSFTNAALCERALHLRRDVDVLAVPFGAERQVLGVESHSWMIRRTNTLHCRDCLGVRGCGPVRPVSDDGGL